MKNLMIASVSFAAVLVGLGLAATASANRATVGTTVQGGKDGGHIEMGLEKGDAGH